MIDSIPTPYYCNICKKWVPEWDESPEGPSRCPHCRCVGRHRAIASVLDTLGLPTAVPALDIGGDAAMFRSRLPNLLSVDLAYGAAGLIADVERLPIRDGSVPIVLCLDTLEHVRDDLRAVVEIHRVLDLSGVALLTFSCWGATGPSKTPAETGLAEWHLDMSGNWTAQCHRYYTDESAVTLLRQARFDVTLVHRTDRTLGIDGADIFIARKRVTELL